MKTKIFILIISLLLNNNLLAQADTAKIHVDFQENTRGLEKNKPKTNTNTNVFMDKRDLHQYKWVKIGRQIWMAENLAYLPKVCPPGRACGYFVYNYIGNNLGEAMENQNYKNYGVLYSLEAAQKACPPGWHLPSDDEWKILEYFLGMKKEELNKVGKRGKESRALRSKKFWPSEYKDADLYGFNALPAGYFEYRNEQFMKRSEVAVFWSSFDANNQVWCRTLSYDSKKIERSFLPLSNGYSVRCIKD